MTRASRSILLLALSVACVDERFLRSESVEDRLLIVAEIDVLGTLVQASVRFVRGAEPVRYALSEHDAERLAVFEIPTHDFLTSEAEPVPERWFSEATLLTAPASANGPTGACRRCQIPTAEPPFIVSPGDECPVFATGRLHDGDDNELVGSEAPELVRSIGARLRLAWPGACECEPPRGAARPVTLEVCTHDFDSSTHQPERWHLTSDGRIVSLDQGHVFDLDPTSTEPVVTPRDPVGRGDSGDSGLLPGGGVLAFRRELTRQPAHLEVWRRGQRPRRLELGFSKVELVHPLLDGTRDALVVVDEGALQSFAAAYRCGSLEDGADGCTPVPILAAEDCELTVWALRSGGANAGRHILVTEHWNYFAFDPEANQIGCMFPASRSRSIEALDQSQLGRFEQDRNIPISMIGTRLLAAGTMTLGNERWRVVASVETAGPNAWTRWQTAAALPFEAYEPPQLWLDARSPDRISALWVSSSSTGEAQYAEVDAEGRLLAPPVPASAHFGVEDRVRGVRSSTTGWVVLEADGPRYYRRAPDGLAFERVHGPTLPAGRSHLVEREDHRLFQLGPGPQVYELIVHEGEGCPRVERTEAFRLEGVDGIGAIASGSKDGRVVAGVERRGRAGVAHIDLSSGALEWIHPPADIAPIRRIVDWLPGRWVALDANGAAHIVTPSSRTQLAPAGLGEPSKSAVAAAAATGGVAHLGGENLLYRLLPGPPGEPRRTSNLLPGFSGAAWTETPRDDAPEVRGLHPMCRDRVGILTFEDLIGGGASTWGVSTTHRAWTLNTELQAGSPAMWTEFEIGSRGVPLRDERPVGVVDHAGVPVFVYSGRSHANSTVHAYGSPRAVLPFREPTSVLEYSGRVFVSGPRGQLASLRAVPR